MPRAIVTFTTDFGLSDAYVAQMKAAVLRRAPDAQIVDITHLIPPQDVLTGSIALERAVAGFDSGAIHLGVVDPGVGTSRRLLLARSREQWIIGPDNGLLTWTHLRHRCTAHVQGHHGAGGRDAGHGVSG
jgi:S-adenosylmethionine hydrolase